MDSFFKKLSFFLSILLFILLISTQALAVSHSLPTYKKVNGKWVEVQIRWALDDQNKVEENLLQLKLHKKCIGCDLRLACFPRHDYLCNELSMANVDLSGANLHTALLHDKNCNGSNFENANLYNIHLVRAITIKANFRGANLSKSNLSDGNFRGSDFRNAKMVEASLVGADLSSANFEGADLTGANLKGAILCNTIMPDGQINYKDC
jgi:uncharacterized protein YjbI with pentapeptide repeats